MTKSPRSTGSVSNTVRKLQRAVRNDLMTALLRKSSAAQACTDRQLAVQTDGYVAAESVIRVINCCFVVMARRKVVFPSVFWDKRSMSDTVECSACNSWAHRICASMTHDEYQQFSADGMVRSGSMRSHVVRCCPVLRCGN